MVAVNAQRVATCPESGRSDGVSGMFVNGFPIIRLPRVARSEGSLLRAYLELKQASICYHLLECETGVPDDPSQVVFHCLDSGLPESFKMGDSRGDESPIRAVVGET